MRSPPLLLLLCACGSLDADGDLLTDALERTWGTDPRDPDSDGDGLDDGAEVHFHLTDPAAPDSDGDGDDDGWEISVGLDPLYKRSRRYPNDWPHLDLDKKRELQRSAAPTVVTVGERIAALRLRHPDAPVVDLYDFAGDGRPVVLADVGSVALSALLTWVGNPQTSPSIDGDPSAAVREAVIDGSIRLLLSWPETDVEVDGERVAVPTTLELYENYVGGFELHPHIPVLLDTGFATWGHLGRRGMTEQDLSVREETMTFVLLNEDMIVQAINDWTAVEAAIPR